MKKTTAAVVTLSALCIVAFAGEAFARGAGKGQGAQLRDGSCIKTQTKTVTKTQTRQRLQDGSGTAINSTRQGTGQGQMRRLGPGDGTGNTVPPMDGTGYGSPASR